MAKRKPKAGAEKNGLKLSEESNGSTAVMDPPEAEASSWTPKEGSGVILPDGTHAIVLHETKGGLWEVESLATNGEKVRESFEASELTPKTDVPFVDDKVSTALKAKAEGVDANTYEDAMERMAEIERREAECDRLEKDFEAKNKSAKGAKKLLEAEVDALRTFIRTKEEMPLFDPKKPSANGDGHATGDEAWRDVPIEALTLSESLAEKLKDQGFKTIAHIADWSKKGHNLTDIAGVGAATAGVIEMALDTFWASRADVPSEAAEAVDEIEVETDDEDDDPDGF